ncbi:hypothetical protein RB597_003119 [Gaeumannomyces tritici]
MTSEMGEAGAVTTTSEPGDLVVVGSSPAERAQQEMAPDDENAASAPPTGDTGKARAAARQKPVVKLYKHECATKSCPERWSLQRNVDDENRELARSVADVPILHRQTRKKGGKWVTLEFAVQSLEMRAVLAQALARYQDFHPELKGWTFSKPFQPLVHRWERLKELQAEAAREADSDGDGDGEAGAGERRALVDELVAFLTPLLGPSIAARDQTIRTGQVKFDDVWQVFPPGALVVTKLYGVDVVCRVDKYEKRSDGRTDGRDGGVAFWSVAAEYLDWNGAECGWATTHCTIIHYDGLRTIDSFPIVPLDLHTDGIELRSRLVARGRKFEALRGYHYREYEGFKISLENESRYERKPASGRIAVDAFAYFCSTSQTKTALGPLKPKLININTATGARRKLIDDDDDDDDDDDKSSSSSSSGFSSLVDDNLPPRAQLSNGLHQARPPPLHPGMVPPKHWGIPPPPGVMRSGGMPPRPPPGARPPPPPGAPRPPIVMNAGPGPPPPHQPLLVEGTDHRAALSPAQKAGKRSEDLAELTDEECMLAAPWVRGFDMTTKDWALFNVEDIRDVAWNDDAFEKLVLPNNSKELAWAFVENKSLERSSFDDFVESKGRGLIILMFGPPGVGKTYTAEAVAERCRVPLYSMGAAVLGTNPRHVEYQLDRALHLCRLWKAMFLLDEADIFLGARNMNDLMRNELVAVFLTKLEYYEGTLFLTTNRISALDHAFQSRVDLLLPYHDLAPAARRRVWENFVAHAGGAARFDVTEEDLDRLSGIPLNGREIKNLTKSACLLAAKCGGRIPAETLLELAESRVRALEELVTVEGS